MTGIDASPGRASAGPGRLHGLVGQTQARLLTESLNPYRANPRRSACNGRGSQGIYRVALMRSTVRLASTLALALAAPTGALAQIAPTRQNPDQATPAGATAAPRVLQRRSHAFATRRGTPPGGDPMLEVQGEPDPSDATAWANPGHEAGSSLTPAN